MGPALAANDNPKQFGRRARALLAIYTAAVLRALRQWWSLRRRARGVITDALWAELVPKIPLLDGYGGQERERLRILAEGFLRRKAIHGAADLALTDDMRVLIALQACVPVLNLGLGWYRGWVSVIVYPGAFVAPHEYADEAGVVHKGRRVLAGESWERGPVVLSWEDVQAGAHGSDWGNLVIHEFAHKLDLLNGKANGMPPLHREMQRQVWTAAFSAAYGDFRTRVQGSGPLPFDAYGAYSPGEFFAVTSEGFFTEPLGLLGAYPAVYRQLVAFYRQDPAAAGHGARAVSGPDPAAPVAT